MSASEIRVKILKDKDGFIEIASKARAGLLAELPEDRPLNNFEKNQINIYNMAVKQLHEHHTESVVALPCSGLHVGDSLKPHDHNESCDCDEKDILNRLLIDNSQFDKLEIENKTTPSLTIIDTEFKPTSSYLGPYTHAFNVHDSELEDDLEDSSEDEE